MTEEERAEIRNAYFENGGRITRVELAKRFNVNRDTVSACLKGPEFEQMREAFMAAISEEAKATLHTNAMRFVKDWVRASSKAADQGNHKAAKEALQAVGVVAADNAKLPFSIHMTGFALHGIGMPGMAGYTVPELPAPIAVDVLPQPAERKELP